MKIPSLKRVFCYFYKHNKLLKIVKDNFHNKKYLESIDYCNQLIKLNESDYYGHYYKAVNLIELNLLDDAIEYIQKAFNDLDKNKMKILI